MGRPPPPSFDAGSAGAGQVGPTAPAQCLAGHAGRGGNRGLALTRCGTTGCAGDEDEEQPAGSHLPGRNAMGQRRTERICSRRQSEAAGRPVVERGHDHAHGDVPSVRAWASTGRACPPSGRACRRWTSSPKRAPAAPFTNAGSLVARATAEAKLWRSMCGLALEPALADSRTNSCLDRPR